MTFTAQIHIRKEWKDWQGQNLVPSEKTRGPPGDYWEETSSIGTIGHWRPENEQKLGYMRSEKNTFYEMAALFPLIHQEKCLVCLIPGIIAG